MQISRRSFLQYCTTASAALGLGPTELLTLQRALASPTAPSVIWLQGSGCTGCSISFLNYVSPVAPMNAADVLVSAVNLLYHPNLSAAAGDSIAAIIKQAANFVLIVEGGVPTAFGGYACMPWSDGGAEVTFQSAVQSLASRATKIVCVGNCAAFGGVSGMGSNPTLVKNVKTITGKTTINVTGCPPHPDWIVWTLVQLLQGKTIALDSYGRPKFFYSRKVHDQCPLREVDKVKTFGVGGGCLEELGCRGASTLANCPTLKWNNGVNWCVGAGAPCIGCTEPNFPGTNPLVKSEHA